MTRGPGQASQRSGRGCGGGVLDAGSLVAIDRNDRTVAGLIDLGACDERPVKAAILRV
jgi:hypothetical protein